MTVVATIGTDMEGLVRAYIAAFEARDLARCLAFYAEEATIGFHLSPFHGRGDVEEWHRRRFAAEARVLEIERIVVEGDRAVVDAVATSRKLKAWKIPDLRGRVELVFAQGKITRAQFALRGHNPGLSEV
jgi:ketosteroid isomerase-like protein